MSTWRATVIRVDDGAVVLMWLFAAVNMLDAMYRAYLSRPWIDAPIVGEVRVVIERVGDRT